MRNKLLTISLCLLALGASAQPGLDEMQQAQQSLSTSFFSAMDCAMVLSALFGILGALRIYRNWQMGHPRIDEAVAGWFFAAFFVVLSGAFLRAMFGL
jgi:hypothetical protein